VRLTRSAQRRQGLGKTQSGTSEGEGEGVRGGELAPRQGRKRGRRKGKRASLTPSRRTHQPLQAPRLTPG